MHSEPSRTVLGVSGWCCQREPLQMTSFRLSRLRDLMASASRSREELLLVAAMADAGGASLTPHWMSVLSSGTAHMLSATRKCTEPLQLACYQVDKSS